MNKLVCSIGLIIGSLSALAMTDEEPELPFDWATFYRADEEHLISEGVVGFVGGTLTIDTDGTPTMTQDGLVVATGCVTNDVARFDFGGLAIGKDCTGVLRGSRPLLLACYGDMKIDAPFRMPAGKLGGGQGELTTVGGSGGSATSGGSGLRGGGGTGGAGGRGSSSYGIGGNGGMGGSGGTGGKGGSGGDGGYGAPGERLT